MPNWTESELSVVLPTENADKFENLFLAWDGDAENKAKEKYFARCFLNSSERKKNDNGLTRLFVQFNAAWSLHSCLIDGYPQETEGKCPTLEEVCKELKIKRLSAYSRDPVLVLRKA